MAATKTVSEVHLCRHTMITDRVSLITIYVTNIYIYTVKLEGSNEDVSFVFEVILFGGNRILLARQKLYQITSCREDVMPHHCIATGDGNTGDFNLIKIFLTKNIGIRY